MLFFYPFLYHFYRWTPSLEKQKHNSENSGKWSGFCSRETNSINSISLNNIWSASPTSPPSQLTECCLAARSTIRNKRDAAGSPLRIREVTGNGVKNSKNGSDLPPLRFPPLMLPGVGQVDSRFAATTIQLSALIEWRTLRHRIEWQCTIESRCPMMIDFAGTLHSCLINIW